jgi:hypothetical protein
MGKSLLTSRCSGHAAWVNQTRGELNDEWQPRRLVLEAAFAHDILPFGGWSILFRFALILFTWGTVFG